MRRFVLAALVAAIALAAAAAAVAVGALASGGGEKALRVTLAPSVPTDPTFHGVAPGGVPWILTRGEARLKDDGEVDVEIAGLVIPSLGTPGPVTTVSASLFCGPDANAAPAATTQAVRLSTDGDATIAARVSLPATCLAPIVLVHPNGGAARYIAVSGWKTGA